MRSLRRIRMRALATCREAIDADNLSCLSIHDGNERQREGVEVRIWIPRAGIDGKDEALEVTLILCVVRSTVGPWLDDDLKPFR